MVEGQLFGSVAYCNCSPRPKSSHRLVLVRERHSVAGLPAAREARSGMESEKTHLISCACLQPAS